MTDPEGPAEKDSDFAVYILNTGPSPESQINQARKNKQSTARSIATCSISRKLVSDQFGNNKERIASNEQAAESNYVPTGRPQHWNKLTVTFCTTRHPAVVLPARPTRSNSGSRGQRPTKKTMRVIRKEESSRTTLSSSHKSQPPCSIVVRSADDYWRAERATDWGRTRRPKCLTSAAAVVVVVFGCQSA
jgi:hypothetical protein